MPVIRFNDLTYGVGTPVPAPSKGFTRKTLPRVITARFGDGYSQRVTTGINNINDNWDLSWKDIPVEAYDKIVATFILLGGVDYFLWEPPGELVDYKVLCRSWDTEYTSHISRTLKAEFERVYDITP